MIAHLLQSTIFTMAIAVLAYILRHDRASVRHWLWLAASAKFLVPLSFLVALGNRLSWLSPAALEDSDAVAIVNVWFQSSASSAVPADVRLWLVGAWSAGVAAVVFRWSLQWKRVSDVARRAVSVMRGREHEALRRVERSIGIDNRIVLKSSDALIEPGVIGIWRPVLLWPSRLSDSLTDAEIESILAHEACHVRRRDNLFASLHMAATALFWFHPVMWWIGGRLIDERERACDEAVVALGSRPKVYAESILKTCELCIASPLANVAGVTGSDLKERIMRIMANASIRPLHPRKKMALIAAGLIACLVPIGCGMTTRGATAGAAQDTDRGQVYRPGTDVIAPRLVKEVKPQYSERALKAKIQGEVLMQCVVRENGTATDFEIVQSLDPDLDAAAIDAARQWEFEPGTRRGTPVAVQVTITMMFTLKK